MWLFLAFLIVPLIEIGLFIEIGGAIGLWPTLAIVVVTAVLGAWLVRAQGIMAMGRLRSSFSRLEDPAEPLAHAAMILIAGALLLTPGFFTDVIGFALLMPPVRAAAFAYLSKRVHVERFTTGDGPGPHGPSRRRGDPDVIEGDYEDLDRSGNEDRPPSGWTRGH
jgi:UPF0716 protein FxsA